MKKRNYQLQEDPALLFSKTKHMYLNKYYNLFMNSFKWTGLTPEEEDYIMRKFWENGTVAAFEIKNADMLGFAPYAIQSYNMYDFPETVNLINTRNVPFIPAKIQVVNEDVVLGYFQKNKKPVRDIVEYYIERISQVEMVINTNLQTHKLPMLIGVSPTDEQNAKDIIRRILNNEVAVFMNADELNLVKSIANGSQYIIDKLYQYKTELENELLTYLGIDNANIQESRVTVDQVNANNQMINDNAQGFETTLKTFCEKIGEVLGYAISVETSFEPVQSYHEEPQEDKNDSDN